MNFFVSGEQGMYVSKGGANEKAPSPPQMAESGDMSLNWLE
jgi:hypothetical protein